MIMVSCMEYLQQSFGDIIIKRHLSSVTNMVPWASINVIDSHLNFRMIIIHKYCILFSNVSNGRRQFDEWRNHQRNRFILPLMTSLCQSEILILRNCFMNTTSKLIVRREYSFDDIYCKRKKPEWMTHH